jgi:hypothetical protein
MRGRVHVVLEGVCVLQRVGHGTVLQGVRVGV